MTDKWGGDAPIAPTGVTALHTLVTVNANTPYKKTSHLTENIYCGGIKILNSEFYSLAMNPMALTIHFIPNIKNIESYC